MLFYFQKFIEELRENPEKAQMIEQYEKLYPNDLQKDLREQIWYKDYVSKFKEVAYFLPIESKEDFDWGLLLQLAASSFSSVIKFVSTSGSSFPDLDISVDNDGKFISKTVSELWGFQVFRLYEIYVEEQMNFQIHWQEDEQERNEINEQRKFKLKKWNYTIEVQYESEKELIDLLV